MAKEMSLHLRSSDGRIIREILKQMAGKANAAVKALARTGRSALKPTLVSANMEY